MWQRLLVRQQPTQAFWLAKKDTSDTQPTISDKSLIIDHKPSLVGYDVHSQRVIKLIKARTWHEYLKLFWGHSRAHKEIVGNQIMRRLGFRVPEVYRIGYGLLPSMNFQYLGFYVMENMSEQGFVPVRDLIDQGKLVGSERQAVITEVVDGLKKMQAHRIVFTDFHLENVMLNPKGELAWLDTGITTYSIFKQKKFLKKNNYSLERLIRYYRQDYFSDTEQSLIRTLLL